MAAGDQVQIVLDDVQAAGVGYTVPAGQAIQPLAVNATIDGTGAGSAFLPTLEILSDSGHIIARVPTAASVAAGGSAEVTWAPFLKGAAAAGGTYAPSPQLGIYKGAPVSVAAGGSATCSFAYVRGDAILDVTNPLLPAVTVAGVYYVGVSLQGDSVFSSGVSLWGHLELHGSVTGNSYAAAPNVKSTIGPQVFMGGMATMALGGTLLTSCTNWDTSARTVEWVEIIVQLVCVT